MPVAKDEDISPLELVNRRIVGLADAAVDTIQDLLTDDDSAVRLNAAKTILDRAGVTAKTKLELEGGIKQTHALDAEIDLLIKGLVQQKEREVDVERELTEARMLELHAGPTTSETPEELPSPDSQP